MFRDIITECRSHLGEGILKQATGAVKAAFKPTDDIEQAVHQRRMAAVARSRKQRSAQYDADRAADKKHLKKRGEYKPEPGT